MAPSAFVTLCLLALASAAPQTNPENVAKIDALLPEVCTLSQGQSDMRVASLVAQAIDLLKFTPDDAVVGVLDKIRAGQYCADHTKLESLFLDAVAFVGTPGAFKVMEQEIDGGRATGGRVILYNVAMTPLWPIVEEYKLIAENKGTEVIQVIENIIKDKNINIDTIVEELKKLILLVQNTIKDKNINTDTVVLELNKLIQVIKDTIKDKDIHIESIVGELQKFTQLIQDTLKGKGINIDVIIVKLKALFQLALNTIKEKDININSVAVELQKILQLVLDTIKDKDMSIDTIVKEFNKLVQLVLNTIKEKNINIDTIVVELKKFLQLVQITLKDNGINIDTIVGELNLLIKPIMDIIKAKNINMDTIIVELTKLAQPVIDIMVKTVIPVISDALLGAKDFNIDTTRTGQINLDFLIPTSMGFPLKIKLTGTAVVGMQIINNLNVNQGALDSLLKIIPSLNAHVEAELGFGEQLSTGLKLKHDVYTTNGFSLIISQKNGEDLELKYELPEKMELFSVQNEVVLMKSDKALNEVQLFPGEMQDIRIVSNQCVGIVEPITGLMLCFDINTPNPISSNSLPLGKPMMLRVYLQKSDATMNGYRLAAKLRNKTDKKLLKIVAGTYGSANSKESTLKLTYTAEADAHLMTLNIQSSLIKSTTEITFSNQPESKSLQIYSNNKIITFAPVVGSVRVEFKPVTVSNGKTYEVATYAGLAKSLDEKHRLSQMTLSILENGELISAKFVTKTELFPAMFEVEVDLPKNAGLRIYKVEKITVRSSVSSIVVESSIFKKSSEEFQTTLLVLNSGSYLITIDTVHIIAIDSTLIGGATNKVNLMTSVDCRLPIAEFGFDLDMSYENLVVKLGSGIRYFFLVEISSGPAYLEVTVFTAKLQQTLDINNLEFMAEVNVPLVEFSVQKVIRFSKMVFESSNLVLCFGSEVVNMISTIGYTDGGLNFSSKATSQYFGTTIYDAHIKQTVETLPFNFAAEVEISTVFKMILQQTIDHTALTTVAQVELPAVIFPLKIHHVIGINSAFSYNILTDIRSGDSVLFHIEGPLSFDISRILVHQNLDLNISGAFDGTFKILHEITMSLKKMQYTLDMRHTSTPIVFVEFVLDRSNGKEIAVKSTVNVPFVIESLLEATISTSLIHSTLNTLGLPSTEFARRFKGYADFNWVENKFEGDLFMDADNDKNKKFGITGKYILDMTAFKFLLQGDLTVTTLKYGYKLESELASSFDLFQGHNCLEISVSMPSEATAVAKAVVDVEYADSQVTLQPLLSFDTVYGNKYELSSSVVAKLLPLLLNFDLAIETTLSTPQLQQIKLISKFLHKGKYQSAIISIKMILEESVLSETFSFEYTLEYATSTLKETLKAQYGTNVLSLVTDIVLNSAGFQYFVVTQELTLPLAVVKSIKLVFTKPADTYLTLESFIDERQIVKLYLTFPEPTNPIIGIQFPSGIIEFGVAFQSGQMKFRLFSGMNETSKAVNIILRFTPKARAVQFEALMTASSLSEEMRIAVEFELIEPGKAGYDMVSVDVQYQVSEALKLLKATLKELQTIYVHLVNNGLFPDFNGLYTETLKLMKQLPATLNNMRDNLLEMVLQYSDYVRDYILNLYQLYEADIIALRNEIQSDLILYWNIVKTETPGLLTSYVEVIKNTETWNVVQSTLNEVMVNYPTFYDNILDFNNKVIVTYFTDLFDAVSKVLVLPEFDVTQYVATMKKEISTILNNIVSQIRDTKVLMVFQEKFSELKALYPIELGLLEDFYNKVFFTTFTDIVAIVNKILALPALDFQQYLAVVVGDVPELLIKISQRVLETDILQKLRTTYSAVFDIAEDLYNKVVLPTSNDIIAFIRKATALPVDFQVYWTTIQAEIPTIATEFGQRVLDTQVVIKLRTDFPTLFDVAEDFYSKVVIPTLQDDLAFVQKLISLPILDIEAAITNYWDILGIEVPSLISRLIQRIPNTQLASLLQTKFTQLSSFLQIKFNEIKDQYPEVYSLLLDFYTKVAVPAIADVPMLYNKIIEKTDIYQLSNFVSTEVLAFVNNLLKNISTTDLFSKLNAVLDQLVSVFPEEYNAILQAYKQINEITVDNIITAFNSHLFDKYGMSYSISTEKFTAVVPLPVSAATLRNCYQIITVHVPTYVIDHGKLLYQYIEAQVPIVMDFLNNEVNSFLVFVQDGLYVYYDEALYIIAHPGVILHHPYVQEIRTILYDFYQIGRSTAFGKMSEKKVRDMIELLFKKFNEVFELYQEEILVVWDFVRIFLDYANWIINTVMESPTVKLLISFTAPEDTRKNVSYDNGMECWDTDGGRMCMSGSDSVGPPVAALVLITIVHLLHTHMTRDQL